MAGINDHEYAKYVPATTITGSIQRIFADGATNVVLTDYVMGTYTGNDGGAIASQTKVSHVGTDDITIIKGTYLDGPFIAFKSDQPAVIYCKGDIIQTNA